MLGSGSERHMLARLIMGTQSAVSRIRDWARTKYQRAHPSKLAEFRPMQPLSPPAAVNDDVMQPLAEAVAQELRRSGHLR